MVIVGILLLGIGIFVWGRVSAYRNAVPQQKIATTNCTVTPTPTTLTITTQMSELVIVEPDENIIQRAVTHGVEWEKYVNGVLVRYYPVGKAWVDMVPPDQIGVIETVAYRICDGQAAQTMQVAYCKYRTDKPPRNWFQAALRNKH